MKIESNKNWTTCLRLNTGDGSPRVFLLNSHFLGSVPKETQSFVYIQSITYSQKNIKNRAADEISIHLGTTTTSFFRK